MCLYNAQISGERLQDHWSSGLFRGFEIPFFLMFLLSFFNILLFKPNVYLCTQLSSSVCRWYELFSLKNCPF